MPNAQCLVASAPLLAAISEVRADIRTIQKWSPQDEVADAMEKVCKRLDIALREAASTSVWLTVEEVATVSHRPISTITHICREHGQRAGAHKVKGVWSIHWPTFEAFVMTGQTPNTQEAA